MTTRWGIAATGGMAAAFATDLALVPDAELAFVGSRTPERAAEFAGRFSATGSGTYRELLAADLDVVYVATPHPQHHALALAAIEAGIPVLVEKAFTATLAGAREVVDAARAASTTSCAPARVAVNAFSTSSGVPPSIAASASAWCCGCGVAT